MAQNAVKCLWKKYVLLPDAIFVSEGNDCACPSSCPNYKKNQSCCKRGRFSAKRDSGSLPEGGVETVSYTDEELAANFPDYVPPASAASATTSTAASQSGMANTGATPIASVRSNGPAASTATAMGKKYTLGVGALDRPALSPRDSAVGVSAGSPLAPHKNYSWFNFRGRYYTADGRGPNDLNNVVCASNLFSQILRTFDIDSVFNGEDVDDGFLWVLDKTLNGDKRDRATMILNYSIEREEKFFLLFYGVLLSGRRLPFYWSDGFTPNLQPVYQDEKDFYRSIASGRDGGFYQQHLKPILFWMNKLSLSKWTDDEAEQSAWRNVQDGVARDSSLDIVVFYINNEFVCLGKKTEFVDNLTASDKSLSDLENTAAFLSRFDIRRQGGRYIITPYVDNERTVNVDKSDFNDDILGMLFPSGKSKDKLELYLYIIKRYCMLFNPSSVAIGPIVFDEDHYTDTVEQLVLEACAYVFGNASTDAQKRAAYNKALLAKLLYSHSVLFGNAASARDKEYMEKLLSLISNNYTDSSITSYFEICKNTGNADKIKLFANDGTVIPPRKGFIPINAWLRNAVNGTSSTVDLCSLLDTPIFRAYRNVFGVGDAKNGEVHNLFTKFAEKEKEIRASADKL